MSIEGILNEIDAEIGRLQEAKRLLSSGVSAPKSSVETGYWPGTGENQLIYAQGQNETSDP